jgi:DNA-directed RNA polymerase specialized sigma24 family protein
MSIPADSADPVGSLAEDTLVANAAAGDRPSVEELLRRHVQRAWRVACAITTDKTMANEAVVRAFAAALIEDDDRGLGAFRARLLGAVRNEAVDAMRAAGGGPATGATRSDPALAAFEDLLERWRSALWLLTVEGLPDDEAALALGLSIEQVRQLAARARAEFRDRYIRALGHGDLAPACRDTVHRLPSYVEGKVTAEHLATISRHLDRCSSCTHLAAELEDPGPALVGSAAPMPAALTTAVLDEWRHTLPASIRLASVVKRRTARPERAPRTVLHRASGPRRARRAAPQPAEPASTTTIAAAPVVDVAPTPEPVIATPEPVIAMAEPEQPEPVVAFEPVIELPVIEPALEPALFDLPALDIPIAVEPIAPQAALPTPEPSPARREARRRKRETAARAQRRAARRAQRRASAAARVSARADKRNAGHARRQAASTARAHQRVVKRTQRRAAAMARSQRRADTFRFVNGWARDAVASVDLRRGLTAAALVIMAALVSVAAMTRGGAGANNAATGSLGAPVVTTVTPPTVESFTLTAPVETPATTPTTQPVAVVPAVATTPTTVVPAKPASGSGQAAAPQPAPATTPTTQPSQPTPTTPTTQPAPPQPTPTTTPTTQPPSSPPTTQPPSNCPVVLPLPGVNHTCTP